jgi:2-dehydropantoate 2-reductase
MRYVILGAGAIGGTIGGRLADAGHDVVLVARGRHATAMRKDGLRLATPDRVMTVHPEVVDNPGDLGLRADDVLVLATKTQDSRGLLDEVAGLEVTGADSGADAATALPVLCAQNGVENERIALRRFRHVLGGCVMLPAVLLEPGRIDAQGTPSSGMLEIGRYPSGLDEVARQLVRDLSDSGFVANERDDVMRWKYAKLLRNTGNSLQALCGTDLDEEGERVAADLARRATTEGERALHVAGIDYVGDAEWQANRGDRVGFGVVEGRERGGGSSWQSVVRGAGSIEADALNGEIVMLGREHGVATPVNELLQRAANSLVRRGGRPGEVTPAELRDRLAAAP